MRSWNARTISPQSPHERDGLAPAGLAAVLVLQRGHGLHARPLAQLRDAGVDDVAVLGHGGLQRPDLRHGLHGHELLHGGAGRGLGRVLHAGPEPDLGSSLPQHLLAISRYAAEADIHSDDSIFIFIL